MKKLINSPDNVEKEALEGFHSLYSDLVEVRFDPTYVVRKNPKAEGKVGIVSGGGSGHEPLHAGFVGMGMLDAAVPGPVFTSPTSDPIIEATRAANRGAGVVYLVKNYTGDVLNFETAAEFAEADDITVTTVIIDDDVAVEDSLYTAGRRGVAGTVLVEKIAGASAERGDDLQTVVAIATRVNANMRSIGLALGPCTSPHSGKPSFTLDDDEIEFGIGIHGEPGYRRAKIEPADTLIEEMYAKVKTDLALSSGEKVITLVNGLGATPHQELYIAHRALDKLLRADGVKIVRAMEGNYVTSLDMPGVSITILRVDDELTELFDAPVFTPTWK